MINARYKFNIALADNFSTFYRGKFLLIKYKKNNLLHSRISVLVSRRNSPLSNKRNKIKRLVYNLFRVNKCFLNKYCPPTDFLIIITTNMSYNYNQNEFIQELKNALSI